MDNIDSEESIGVWKIKQKKKKRKKIGNTLVNKVLICSWTDHPKAMQHH